MNITKTPSASEGWASLSPDGRKLLFTRSEGCCASVVMVANADGTGAVPLHTSDPRYQDDDASWSPGGSQVALAAYDKTSGSFEEKYALFIYNADGSNPRKIADLGPRFPSWSPDGQWIAYDYSFFQEVWGQYGEIEIHTRNVTSGSDATLTSRAQGSRLMSPQAWRR